MANELMTMEKLTEIAQMTVMSTNQLSQQLGLVVSTQTQLIERMDSLESTLKTNTDAINNRMQNYEDRIRIDRNQAQSIRGAIHARAAKLLGIEYVDGIIKDPDALYADKYYRSGFISKIYSDARKHSRLGTPYYETYSRDYEEVVDYIEKWMPVVGVAGYKNYLDERRNR